MLRRGCFPLSRECPPLPKTGSTLCSLLVISERHTSIPIVGFVGIGISAFMRVGISDFIDIDISENIWVTCEECLEGERSRQGECLYEKVRGVHGSIALCYRAGRRDAVFASAR